MQYLWIVLRISCVERNSFQIQATVKIYSSDNVS